MLRRHTGDVWHEDSELTSESPVYSLDSAENHSAALLLLLVFTQIQLFEMGGVRLQSRGLPIIAELWQPIWIKNKWCRVKVSSLQLRVLMFQMCSSFVVITNWFPKIRLCVTADHHHVNTTNTPPHVNTHQYHCVSQSAISSDNNDEKKCLITLCCLVCSQLSCLKSNTQQNDKMNCLTGYIFDSFRSKSIFWLQNLIDTNIKFEQHEVSRCIDLYLISRETSCCLCPSQWTS